METPVTATEIMIRMDQEDQKRLLEDIEKYKGMVITLHINDRQNRFNLGTFEAKITKWNKPTNNHKE